MVSLSESKSYISHNSGQLYNSNIQSVHHRIYSPKSNIEKSSPRRFSAVEALEASKKDYVKSENVRIEKQMPKNAGILQLGLRRKSINDEPSSAITNNEFRKDEQIAASSTPPPVPPRIKKTYVKSSETKEFSKNAFNVKMQKDSCHKHIIDSAGTRSAPTLRKFPKMSISPKEQFSNFALSPENKENKHRKKVFQYSVESPKVKYENRDDDSSDLSPGEDEGKDLKNPENLFSGSVRRRAQKSVHRSKSDINKRYSNSSDLSDVNPRLSRDSADLERFFNEMGLDKNVLEPMIKSHTSQPLSSDFNLCDSLNSLDSPLAISLSSDGVNVNERETRESDSSAIKTERTCGSVVERNARIIKWLCNVRKAHSQEDNTQL